jgi:hypothetical protein
MDMNGHKLQLLASLHVLLDERNVTRGGAWHARFDNDPDMPGCVASSRLARPD